MGATENGVFTLGREADIELEAGAALPWLSNRGHLNPMLAGVVPETNFGILSTMHQRLGGDENLLAGKRAGSSPRPDFVLPEYRALTGRWSSVADSYRAAKPAADFPHAGGPPRAACSLRHGPRPGRALFRLASPARASS